MWRQLEPLAALTTFRIGGPARWFAEPRDEAECLTAWLQARCLGCPIYVLGGGSNLLVSDQGAPGAVISTRRVEPRRIERNGRAARASAGVPLPRLVRWAAVNGLAGIEHLAGIPGLVGGAVVMNAGGRQGCIGERVSLVRGVEPSGRLAARAGCDVRWDYRSSGLDGWLVTAVELDLRRDRPEAVGRRTREAMERKRASQPVGAWSAGCVFRNPPGEAAGRLIDRAGLKGRRRGDAEVAREHANFIVNRGRARAADVLALIGEVRANVRRQFGRELELEIRCWP